MYTDKLGKRHYSKDDKTLDFLADQIGGYVITMEVSSEGNLTQSDINENYFFNQYEID